MKVVYDISCLGMGYVGNRSGLFRATENIAQGLIESPECDLTFCASFSLEAWSKSLFYLEANPRFNDIPFISQGVGRDCHKNIYNSLVQFISSLHKSGFRQTKNLQKFLVNLLEVNFYALDFNDIKTTEIFHSLYYPLPQKLLNQVKTIKKFLTIHDLIPILYPQFCIDYQRFELSKILKSLEAEDFVFCVSNAVKNDLCNHFKNLNSEQVFVTYLGASELFYPCLDAQKNAFIKQKYKIPDAPYILSLSTLEPRKNTVHTIRCFAQLIRQEKIKDLYLVLAGKKGSDYNQILATIANEDWLKERIIITGYVADEDLAALYSGAIAFVFPSFCEGFGLPPLEAMQCGTPVIASNTTSLPEVVGEAGIMLAPQDSDGLCHSMLEIYNHPSLRDTLSLKSIERAKQFSWSNCIQQTIDAYKKALS